MTAVTLRWVLSDTASADTWTMPINPDEMTSPHPAKSLSTSYGSRNGTDRVRTFLSAPAIKSWEWSGVIRSKAHYDNLLAWAEKPNEIHVTDHLGYTWEVVIQKFSPIDRKPTALVTWRMRYTMQTLVLRMVP